MHYVDEGNDFFQGNTVFMQPNSQALAEAKALITCIQVTRDPAEQNRLWNRYYRLSDEVFPEAKALHDRYKQLKGDSRQRFKNEYMELVRRLWKATDPEAAHDISFTQTAPPAARAKAAPPATPPAAPRNSLHTAALLLVFLATVASGGVVWWQKAMLPQHAQSDVAPPLEGPSGTTGQAGVATPPTQAAIAEALLRPFEPTEPPLEAIEAELERTIVPALKPIPPALQGRGDQVVADGVVYHDVYAIESESQYFLRVPETGRVESVLKAKATVTLAADPEKRKALLALWHENKAAIAQADAQREKEKQLRIAAHYRAQETERRDREKALEQERWRIKGLEWQQLSETQRQAQRQEAYAQWQAVREEIKLVESLYYRINRGYELIGISDNRVNRLTTAYDQWSQDLGPDMQVEEALITYSLNREETLRELAGWEEEYYRLVDHVNKVYPEYEARAEEIQRLDEALPPEQRLAEAIPDWNKPPEGQSPALGGRRPGVGTGFLVADGYVLTCAHVVRGGNTVRATSTAGTAYAATVVTMDTANDWALLRVDGLTGTPIPVAADDPNVGATIHCLGYPLGGIRDSADPIVGSGNIAALQRLDGEQRYMQITAPVNPGSSGGPVLDQYGRWVGIVSQKLNDQKTLDVSQTVSQGINFAVKATVILPLVEAGGVVQLSEAAGAPNTPMSLEEIAANLAPSIVRINVE